jgi:hypothetical protein
MTVPDTLIRFASSTVAWHSGNGRLYIEAEPERLYPAILQFAQTWLRFPACSFSSARVIQSLFYEQLAEFIEERLGEFMHRPGFSMRAGQRMAHGPQGLEPTGRFKKPTPRCGNWANDAA